MTLHTTPPHPTTTTQTQYQQYLSCYSFNFVVKIKLCFFTRHFFVQKFFGSKIIFYWIIFLETKFSLFPKDFFDTFLWKMLSNPQGFRPKIFWTEKLLRQKNHFWTKYFFNFFNLELSVKTFLDTWFFLHFLWHLFLN